MRRVLGSAALLLAIYVGLSFLNSPRGFLGTDTGGKVATLRVMAAGPGMRLDPDLGYWAARWDPEGRVYPVAFTSHVGHKWVNVTTLPALLAALPLYAAGGYRAALLVPMLGAVLAALAARALARRFGAGERWSWAVFWLAGLASPLAIYALDFWEHSAGVAAVAWAVVLLVDGLALTPPSHSAVGSPPRRGALACRTAGAGALFGLAATMRTEALVYALVAGVVAAVVLLRRQVPLATCAVAGLAFVGAFAVPLALNAGLERAVVGSQVRAPRTAGTALGAGDAPSGRVDEALMTTAAMNGSGRGIALGLLLAALLGVAAWRGRSDPPFALAALAGAAAVYLLRILGDGLGFVPGLLAATPIAVLAVLGGAAGGSTNRSALRRTPPSRTLSTDPIPTSRFTLATRQGSSADGTTPADAGPAATRRIVVAIALGAVPLVLFFQFRGGAAPQWAGRYLLPTMLLLLAVGASTGLPRLARPVAIGFIALSVGVTAFGLAWLSVRSHDVARTMRALDQRPENVLVSSVPHLVREGGAFYGDRRWLTAEDDASRAVAARVVTDSGAFTMALVEDASARPVRNIPGFTRMATSRIRLFHGVDLRVSSWVADASVSPPAAASTPPG